MYFLDSFYLWFILLAGIPILLHFFNKRKYEKYEFPSLMLIKEFVNKYKRLSSIKNILLLLTRVLIIVFLVILLAKPYYKQENISNFKKIVFVLDNSLSMNSLSINRTNFEQAKEIIKKVVENNPEDIKYNILTLRKNKKAVFDHFVNKNKLLNEIKKINITSDIESLKEEDFAALPADLFYIISDGDAKNFYKLKHKIKNKAYIRLLDYRNSVKLEKLKFYPQIPIANNNLIIYGYGSFPENTNAKLIIFNKEYKFLTEKDRFKISIKIPEIEKQEDIQGIIALETDENDLDNIIYFTKRVRPVYKIGIYSKADELKRLINLSSFFKAENGIEDIEKYDIVIIRKPDDKFKANSGGFIKYINRNKSALIFLTDEENNKFLNRFFSAYVNISSILPAYIQEKINFENNVRINLLDNIELNNKLKKILKHKDFLEIKSVFNNELASKSVILAKVYNIAAITLSRIIRGEKESRIICFNFDYKQDSSMYIKPDFVPFIYEILFYLARASYSAPKAIPALPGYKDFSIKYYFYANNKLRQQNYRAKSLEHLSPGNYVLENNNKQYFFSKNINIEEFKIEKIKQTGLNEIFPNTVDLKIQEQFKKTLNPEIVFLILFMILIILELYLYLYKDKV